MKPWMSHAALPVALLLALAACEAKKSSNPLSPSVAGPIPGVEITAPRLLEPQQGFKFRENQQPIQLLIENSSSTGVRPLSYMFEVASDSEFNTRVFARSGVPAGEGGRTSVQVDTLELGRAYYWRARAEDGANNSSFAAAHFEVLPTAVFTLPVLLSPVNNEVVPSREPTLRIRNSEHNSAIGNVSYFFVIATDQAFTQISATGWVNEGAGETNWTSDRTLDPGGTHFWRVLASDGDTSTNWSPTQAFRTPAPAVPSPPAPGPAPGGPCMSTSPDAIVACERSKYPGFMSSSQIVSFLRGAARSLNANGVPGGPFGILRKGSGNQCGGYSCDIICSGQGNGQRQWDVLGDVDGAQTPGWFGPETVPHIRVDVCEIQ
jgi:hypothetical protein